MSKCFEQEVCKVSYMHSNQKRKFNDYYMKLDPPLLIGAHFECMNVPVESNDDCFMDKLFVQKPVALCYNIVINSHSENLNSEKDC